MKYVRYYDSAVRGCKFLSNLGKTKDLASEKLGRYTSQSGPIRSRLVPEKEILSLTAGELSTLGKGPATIKHQLADQTDTGCAKHHPKFSQIWLHKRPTLRCQTSTIHPAPSSLDRSLTIPSYQAQSSGSLICLCLNLTKATKWIGKRRRLEP